MKSEINNSGFARLTLTESELEALYDALIDSTNFASGDLELLESRSPVGKQENVTADRVKLMRDVFNTLHAIKRRK